MAETAKILNPERTVVLPDLEAGCSLASGCPADRFAAWIARHPGAVVVSYINCTAEVKALCDYIVTSSNAEKIVRSIPEDKTVLFAPDRNLGAYLEKKIGRKMHPLAGQLHRARDLQPAEARGAQGAPPGGARHRAPRVRGGACSRWPTTSARRRRSSSTPCRSPAKEFIVVTEAGILHQMQKQAPDKTFIPAPPDANCACNECPFMKKNTLEKVYLSLRDLDAAHRDEPRPHRARAKRPIERMLALS